MNRGHVLKVSVLFFCALTFFLCWQGFCFGLGWGGPCHSFLAQGCGVCPLTFAGIMSSFFGYLLDYHADFQ